MTWQKIQEIAAAARAADEKESAAAAARDDGAEPEDELTPSATTVDAPGFRASAEEALGVPDASPALAARLAARLDEFEVRSTPLLQHAAKFFSYTLLSPFGRPCQVSLSERLSRGVVQSSIWASPADVVWALPLTGKAASHWPSLLLAVSGDVSDRAWGCSAALGDINQARVPPHIAKMLERQRRPKEACALVEFLGTHEFAWVKASSLAPYKGAASDPARAAPPAPTPGEPSLESTSAGADDNPDGVPAEGAPGPAEATATPKGSASKGRGARGPAKARAEAVLEADDLLRYGWGLRRSGGFGYLAAERPSPRWFVAPAVLAEERAAAREGRTPRLVLDGSELDSASEEEEDETRVRSTILRAGAGAGAGAAWGAPPQAPTSSIDPTSAEPPGSGSVTAGPSHGGGGGGGGSGGGGAAGSGAMVHRRSANFPGELETLLAMYGEGGSVEDSSGGGKVVGWSADGLRVVVRDVARLENELMAGIFRRIKKFSTFKFQMTAFGFKRPPNDPAEPAPAVSFVHPAWARANGGPVNTAALKAAAEAAADEIKAVTTSSSSATISKPAARPPPKVAVMATSSVYFTEGAAEARRAAALARVEAYIADLRARTGEHCSFPEIPNYREKLQPVPVTGTTCFL